MSGSSLRAGAGALCKRMATRTPALMFALALLAAWLPLSPAPAAATSFELYPYAGYMLFDNDLFLKDKLGFGGKAGLYFGAIGIEGNLTYVKTEVDTTALGGGFGGDPDLKVMNYGGDLVFRIAHDKSVVPYLLAGAGVTKVSFDDDAIAASVGHDPLLLGRRRGSAVPALGHASAFASRPGPDVQARIQRHRQRRHLRHNIIAAGGLSTSAFGGGSKDTDNDGVNDKNDRCPDTPLGCRVDADGCPIDSDKDGVCDGIDQCPDTPAGAPSTRAAARRTATRTACSTASTSARTRPRAWRWTSAAARATPTATACPTTSISARTRRPAWRWTSAAARRTPTATASRRQGPVPEHAGRRPRRQGRLPDRDQRARDRAARQGRDHGPQHPLRDRASGTSCRSRAGAERARARSSSSGRSCGSRSAATPTRAAPTPTTRTCPRSGRTAVRDWLLANYPADQRRQLHLRRLRRVPSGRDQQDRGRHGDEPPRRVQGAEPGGAHEVSRSAAGR